MKPYIDKKQKYECGKCKQIRVVKTVVGRPAPTKCPKGGTHLWGAKGAAF